jgi:MYXO-CTERM domain-containing protein
MAQNLEWGGSYYARAKGLDSRGAETPYSNVNQFNVRANSSPTAPALGTPFNNCGATGFTVTQPPGQITVPNVNDVEMDVITVEVQLFKASDDPATATPLFATAVNQQGALDTLVLFTGVQWANGDYRVRTRFKDPYNTTAWTECVFTLAVAPPMPDAGMSDAGTGGGSGSDAGVADAGTGGSGGGSTQATKPGCGCSSADPVSLTVLWLALAQLLRSRRRD